MRRRVKVLVFLLAVSVIVSISSVAISAIEQAKTDKKAEKQNIYAQLELFGDAVSVIKSEYVDDVDSKKLIYGAMKGMLSSLDDFSQFLEPEDFTEMKVETKGEFGGVGIEITMRDGILTILTPISGTPGEAAGLQPGDKIVKIDGVITKDLKMSDAVKKMRGKPGSSVTLTIWRENNRSVFDVPIKRDIIRVKSVKDAKLIDGKIGYIKLVEFQENSPKELEDALKKLEAEKMDALILDLRYNPGGLLEVAVGVAEKFLKKDSVVVSIKSRNPDLNTVFKSTGTSTHPDYPIVVLVNEGSASASEIVAGAIQDNKRGLIVGKNTFGKASVQTVIPMKDGSALRLTTASYYTPSGNMIRNQGITPDVIAEREDLGAAKDESEDIFEDLDLEAIKPVIPSEKQGQPVTKKARDSQLERAVDIIKAIRVYKAKS